MIYVVLYRLMHDMLWGLLFAYHEKKKMTIENNMIESGEILLPTTVGKQLCCYSSLQSENDDG